MKKSAQQDSPNDLASRNRPGWPWFLGIGCIAIFVIVLIARTKSFVSNAHTPGQVSANETRLSRSSGAPIKTTRSRQSSLTEPRPAEEIVAEKVRQFARSRLGLVQRMASEMQVEVPQAVD